MAGSGFPPGSPLVSELFSDPVVLGTTVADANGAFRLTVTVPATTAAGLHTLRVRTVDGAVFADTTLAVVAPVATTAPLVAAGALSRTGTEVAGPARMALGLLAVGVVLVGLAHRRPQWPGGGRRWP